MSRDGLHTMHAERYQRVKEIYQAAHDLDAASRDSFVAGASNGDADVRAEVEHLLRADASSGRFLETPVLDANQALDAVAAGNEALLERIGRYRIIRLLGEGGMGSVYEAEQDSPRRRVALKILRAGAMQPRMLQRFQREVEVLGRLQHPGIARIYDAGVAEESTSNGRTIRVPFFAMELILGSPITTFAQKKGLSIRHRLTLLAEVCNAVHFGHQHGIVHRDLKPGNVLVGISSVQEARPLRPDGTPASLPSPKIIDFGVARVTNADLAASSQATDAGQIIGTLAYMSPEQVCGDPSRIDAQSDVYALGVIGYELLTDRMPYEVADKVAPEAARIIRDEEPSRMSSISRIFRGDVETIFAKALEKEPARRYQTAAELAADIRAFLDDEPIIARPPTLRYQLVKFAKRHKEFVVGLALVFIVLMAGIVGTTMAMFRAIEQEKQANIAKADATTAAATAKSEAERALSESRKAQRVSELMRQVLSFARPGTPGGGRDVKVVEMLDKASEELLGQLADAPEIEFSLRRTLAETYARLDIEEAASLHFARARELAIEVYGTESLELYDLMATMVVARVWRSNSHETELGRSTSIAVDQCLAAARGKVAPDHPTMQRLLFASGRMNTLMYRADAAIAALTELLGILQSIDPSRHAVCAYEVRAMLIYPTMAALQFQKCEELAREVLATVGNLRQPSAQDARLLATVALAGLDAYALRIEDAAHKYREILSEQQAALGPDHQSTHGSLQMLRGLALRAGDLQAAKRYNDLERESVERTGTDAPWLAYLDAYQAWILARLGQPDEAAQWFTKAVAQRLATVGRDALAHEYSIHGIAAGGRLFQPWASESIRRYVLQHVLVNLTDPPEEALGSGYVRWNEGTYRLEHWNGSQLATLDTGSYFRLADLPDPEPGLYRLVTTIPLSGGGELIAGDWMLAAPWSLDVFPAYRLPDAVNPDVAVEYGSHERRSLPMLMFHATYVDALGPAGAQLAFGINARAELNLPPGRYRLRAYVDDGARIWLDDQLLAEKYDQRRTHDGQIIADFEADGHAHELRVQYFQFGQAAALWITAEPADFTEPAESSPR